LGLAKQANNAKVIHSALHTAKVWKRLQK